MIENVIEHICWNAADVVQEVGAIKFVYGQSVEKSDRIFRKRQAFDTPRGSRNA